MIAVENLTKRYETVTAIEGVSFTVGKGEILGFLGPNGAGKTTTMRILTCFMPPTSGKAVVAGFDCFEDPLEVKKRIGYLPESAPLYREMKIIEYLDFAARVKGLSGAMKSEKIDEVMEETDIIGVKGRLIGKLSKGFRQRVGLAQALLNDPEVLILDEPTAGLDPKQIVEIRQLIKAMSGKRTVILSTHILPEVSIVCDRVVIIHRGKVVAVDTPQNLIARGQKRSVVQVVIDAPPDEAVRFISGIPGVKNVAAEGYVRPDEITLSITCEMGRDLRRDLSAAVVGKGWGLLEVRKVMTSLEEIFVDLVTEDRMEPPAPTQREGRTDV